ncbi:WD40 repeat domain-containing serine/threonine-protein kinase [Roseiconus nitratireducens]|nr:serine/threonine-protein kinase [Roseiconus nitratireducens]
MSSVCPNCKRTIADEETVISVDDPEDRSVTKQVRTCPDCGAYLSLDQIDGLEFPTQAQFPTQAESLTSDEFAHFRLIQMLGKGGFGTVWLAEDLQLDRQIALKLPSFKRPDMGNLIREAKTAAKLQHPNIVSIHQVGESAGQVYIVCEYIKGMDLRALLSKGTPPIAQSVELLRGIAKGLQHAHEHNIVHRDMKPGNVLVDDAGTPLVTDFGLAKRIDIDESISSRGRIIGTVMYMAPEQASGDSDQVDRRADLYALGVMMYEMLTGERPYRGNVQAVLHDKVNEDPAPLRRLLPSVPRDLETICLKCLQRSPARRYESAGEFIAELDRYTRGEPIEARPVSSLEYAWRWCTRNRMVSGLAALLFASLIIGLASTTTFWWQATQQAEKARRALYASRMALATYYLGRGDITTARSSLDEFLTPELAHLRAFEWYYLDSQLRRFKPTAQHGNLIHDVAMSREGDWYASVGDDRNLRIWETETGKVLREIPARIGRWQAAAVSPRDNQLAAGSKDGSVYVWDAVGDAQRPPRVIQHGRGVSRLVYSQDGRRLFSAADTGAVRVWDTKDFKLISEIPTGKDGLVCLAVSADGATLVVVGSGGMIRAWEVDTRAKICTIEAGQRVEAVAMRADASQFVTGSYSGMLAIFDTKTGSRRQESDTDYGWITDLDFLDDSPIIALLTSGGETVFFDTEEFSQRNMISTHDRAGGRLAVSKDGRTLVVGSRNGMIAAIDSSDFRSSYVMNLGRPVRTVRVVSDRVFVASGTDGSVQWMDLDKRAIRPLEPPSDAGVAEIACSQTAALIAIHRPNGQVDVLDASGTPLRSIQVGAGYPVQIAFSNAGDRLLIAKNATTLLMYDMDPDQEPLLSNRTTITAPPSDGVIRDVCFSHDDSVVAVAWDEGHVRFFETDSGQWRAKALTFDDLPVSLAFQSDALAVGLRDGDIACFDSKSGKERWRSKAHIGHLNMVVAIPGSAAFASVGRDRSLYIWDALSGDLRTGLLGHRHQVFSVDATADGNALVTSGLKGDVRLWASRED